MSRRKMRPFHIRRMVGLMVMGFALIPSVSVAQSSHYWTEQYGNRSYLLSGAVVGDTADLSAIYYNPGGLALILGFNFSL